MISAEDAVAFSTSHRVREDITQPNPARTSDLAIQETRIAVRGLYPASPTVKRHLHSGLSYSRLVPLRQVHLDPLVAEQLSQFAVQEVVQQVSVSMVEPDAVILVPVVALRSAVDGKSRAGKRQPGGVLSWGIKSKTCHDELGRGEERT